MQPSLTATDLRVGNYVNYENTTHVIDEIHRDKVTHHWLNSKQKKFDVYTCPYQEIESIPLCPKEIEKLGFIFDEEKNFFFDDYGYFLEDSAGEYYLSKYGNRITQVDFVHELQNVYFQITKRELTY